MAIFGFFQLHPPISLFHHTVWFSIRLRSGGVAVDHACQVPLGSPSHFSRLAAPRPNSVFHFAFLIFHSVISHSQSFCHRNGHAKRIFFEMHFRPVNIEPNHVFSSISRVQLVQGNFSSS